MPIVAELTTDHKKLLNRFDEILEHGLRHPEASRLVAVLQSEFSAHLDREQREVYDLLARVARSSQALNHVLSLFIREVREIETMGQLFFSNWQKTPGNNDLDQAFARFHEAFKVRVRHEEEIIFTEFSLLQSFGETDGSGI